MKLNKIVGINMKIIIICLIFLDLILVALGGFDSFDHRENFLREAEVNFVNGLRQTRVNSIADYVAKGGHHLYNYHDSIYHGYPGNNYKRRYAAFAPVYDNVIY